MKESELRAIIREHVKRTLKEAGPSLGAGSAELERGLGKISDRSSQLTKRQRVQAVIPVLQKFGITSADMPMIKAVLSKMSEPKPEPKPEPEVEENYTAGVDDGNASVNEASRFKGKEIYPNWVTPNQMKGMVRNVRDLTKGALYAILEPGMDVWQAEYEYAGKVGPMHLFKSTAQGTGDESDMEFTDSELNDLVKSAEISLMESLNEARRKKVTEGALDAKSAKLDKSQAWQMLVKAVDSKPATQQADFIVDLINKFNLDDSVKRRLKMQIKNMA